MSEPNESMPPDVQIEDESWRRWPMSALSRRAGIHGINIQDGTGVYYSVLTRLFSDQEQFEITHGMTPFGTSLARILLLAQASRLVSEGKSDKLSEIVKMRIGMLSEERTDDSTYALFLGYHRSTCARRRVTGSYDN